VTNTIEKDKPKIHRHDGCGLEYLSGARQVLFETGVTMPRLDFDKVKNDENFPDYLDKAAQDPANRDFDWRYACSTGHLRRKRNRADLVANARTERRRARQVEKVQKIESTEQKKATVRQYIFSSAFLVMVVMAIVGVGSAVMSAYHTSVFLHDGGKPAWASLMTGVMLILFSGTAFTAARYFFQERGVICVFGMLFIVAGLAVIVYSMFSTLTVNFNQFKWRDDAEAVAAVEGSEALAAHREQLQILEEEIDDVANEITVLRREADYWRTQSWRRYDSIQERITGGQKYLNSLRERYGSLVGETPRLVEVEAVSQETIYDFLANIFKVKKDTMRFFVYIVPACLYDILAPFALSVVLLLADKRRNQSEQAGRNPAC
jgi:hypothetical protein